MHIVSGIIIIFFAYKNEMYTSHCVRLKKNGVSEMLRLKSVPLFCMNNIDKRFPKT